MKISSKISTGDDRIPHLLNSDILLESVLGIAVRFRIARENEYRIELSKIDQQEFSEESKNLNSLLTEPTIKLKCYS